MPHFRDVTSLPGAPELGIYKKMGDDRLHRMQESIEALCDGVAARNWWEVTRAALDIANQSVVNLAEQIGVPATVAPIFRVVDERFHYRNLLRPKGGYSRPTQARSRM
jgi:hypothetical protein